MYFPTALAGENEEGQTTPRDRSELGAATP